MEWLLITFMANCTKIILFLCGLWGRGKRVEGGMESKGSAKREVKRGGKGE
jgi:hypothetical protein